MIKELIIDILLFLAFGLCFVMGYGTCILMNHIKKINKNKE